MYATVWYQPRHVLIYYIGVVLQFEEYFKSAKNIKDRLHIPTIIKRGGVSRGYWVWLGGLPMGKKGPKLRSLGESLLQKSAHESGEVAEIESENNTVKATIAT